MMEETEEGEVLEEAAGAAPTVIVPNASLEEEGEASDPELEELLDKSLGEFGKHVPQVEKKPSSTGSGANFTSPSEREHQFIPPEDSEVDGMFNSELFSELESQLGDAMKMFSDKSPELLEQFESFSKSMGMGEAREGWGLPPGTPSTANTTAKSSVDGTLGATGGTRKEEGKEESSKTETNSFDKMLEETLKKLQEQPECSGGGGPSGLEDMLNHMDIGSEEGEDQLMKVMQGMMSTLLSKEVLYPSLMELCKQYPEWLANHQSSLSEEDFQRYSKQLEIMSTICAEFEKTLEKEELGPAASEKVLNQMQELQQYGQPPKDLIGDSQMGMPLGMMGNDPSRCSLM